MYNKGRQQWLITYKLGLIYCDVLLSSILKENYSILEPLIRLDPLLLPLLVNVSRMDDLPDVFSVIPTYLAVAKLFSIVKSIHGHLSAQQVCCV